MVMKKIFALMLAALMLVGVLAACGGDKASVSDGGLEGKWRTTLDMTEEVNQDLADGELGEFMEFSDLGVDLVLEFKGDGTYSMTVDEDALADTMESVKTQFKEGMSNYLAEMMPGVDLDLDELMAEMGLDLDELVDSVDMASELREYNMAGQYKAEGGKLYLSESADEEPPVDEYDVYILDGDTLTMNGEIVFQRVG